MQILREKMKECYGKEGVNHVTECKDIALKYQAAQKVCSARLSHRQLRCINGDGWSIFFHRHAGLGVFLTLRL